MGTATRGNTTLFRHSSFLSSASSVSVLQIRLIAGRIESVTQSFSLASRPSSLASIALWRSGSLSLTASPSLPLCFRLTANLCLARVRQSWFVKCVAACSLVVLSSSRIQVFGVKFLWFFGRWALLLVAILLYSDIRVSLAQPAVYLYCKSG